MKKILNIFLIFAVLISSSACSFLSKSDAPDNVVAKITKVVENEENEETIVITQNEFNKKVNMYKPGIELSQGSDIWTKDVGEGKTYLTYLREIVLDQMILSEIVYSNYSNDEKYKVSEELLNSRFEELNKGLEANKEIKGFYEDNNIDADFLKKQLEKDTLLDNYKNVFEQGINVTDQQISTYFETNKEKFKYEQVHAAHILLSTVDMEADEFKPLKEEDVEKKRILANDLLTKIENGEDFAKLAKEYSEDPGSKEKGGDLGWFSRGKMVPAFEQSSFAMNKKGEMSKVVESKFGFHIIKLLDDKKVSYATLDEVKPMINSKIKEEEFMKNIDKIKENYQIVKVEENMKEE
ncbi:peptidylprolyl isomerase [Peptostreptococcaceae bacterium AGR-M142]